MMMSRNRSKVPGVQLQALAATSNFCSASSSSLRLRPCSVSRFWNPADEIPFFCFVEHPAQRSQCTVGIRCRTAETEPFHIVFCYVIEAHADDFRHRKQPPTVTVIGFRLRRESCRFGPTQKANRELLRAGGLPVQRTGSSHGL